MTPVNSVSEIKATQSIGQVTRLQDVTLKIQNEALNQTYAKMAPAQQSLGLEHLLKNRNFFQRFKYYLAKALAQTLGTNDRQVQAVYLFEPSLNPDADTGEALPLEVTVHLLVLVSKHSAALNTFIEALDQSLTRALNQMPLPLLAKSPSILNAVVLTEEAVEQRQGYGSLVSSILAPPFKLWERKSRAIDSSNKGDTMKNRDIYITDQDLERLNDLLEAARELDYHERPHLAELEAELARGQIIASSQVPANVITMNSTVRLIDLESKEELVFTLVFPNEADIEQNRISILAPIGTALLGYSVGDTVEWQVPDGLSRLKVEEILYQPEASGIVEAETVDFSSSSQTRWRDMVEKVMKNQEVFDDYSS